VLDSRFFFLLRVLDFHPQVFIDLAERAVDVVEEFAAILNLLRGIQNVVVLVFLAISSIAPLLGLEYQMYSQFICAMSGRQRKLMNFSAFSLLRADLRMTAPSTQTVRAVQ